MLILSKIILRFIKILYSITVWTVCHLCTQGILWHCTNIVTQGYGYTELSAVIMASGQEFSTQFWPNYLQNLNYQTAVLTMGVYLIHLTSFRCEMFLFISHKWTFVDTFYVFGLKYEWDKLPCKEGEMLSEESAAHLGSS